MEYAKTVKGPRKIRAITEKLAGNQREITEK